MRNYQKEVDKLIENIPEGQVPTLLLHACCAPCSSYCLEYLSNYFKITLYFYNPNIYPESEYTPETEISMAMLNEPIINVTDCSYLLIERLTLEAGMNNGINVSGGDHVRVAGCDLRQFSKHAVEMRDTKESGVLSCDIEQIGAYGIYIVSGKGNRSTLESVGCYAVNNHVQDFGRIERTYYPGISMEGVGNYIAYNKIHNAPHMALRAEGNNNIIEFNEIYEGDYLQI